MLKKYYWILAGCFLGGILLCGLGAGICFAEFSGFSYAGDRELGQVVNKTLSYQIDEEAEKYYIDVRSFGGYYGYYGYEDVTLITDPSLAANEIQVEVSYNNDLDELWLYGRAYPVEEVISGEDEEAGLMEDSLTDQEEAEEEEAIGEEPVAEEMSDRVYEQKEEVRVREVIVQDIGIHWDYDDLKILMKYKDVILEDLKQGQIGSYGHNPYFKVTQIKCSPDVADKIQIVY